MRAGGALGTGNRELMASVGAGARLAIAEYQHRFTDSSLKPTTADIDLNMDGHARSRESAFTHAITAAGVALAVSRGCCGGAQASTPTGSGTAAGMTYATATGQ
ncbi:unnamed protein product, partial [Iphiclides podalirius]